MHVKVHADPVCHSDLVSKNTTYTLTGIHTHTRACMHAHIPEKMMLSLIEILLETHVAAYGL